MPSLVGSEMCIRDRMGGALHEEQGQTFVPCVEEEKDSGGAPARWCGERRTADGVDNAAQALLEAAHQPTVEKAPAQDGVRRPVTRCCGCLLYTSDAADDLLCVD